MVKSEKLRKEIVEKYKLDVIDEWTFTSVSSNPSAYCMYRSTDLKKEYCFSIKCSGKITSYILSYEDEKRRMKYVYLGTEREDFEKALMTTLV